MAEREGLPRSINKGNKIKGLLCARSRRVYQSRAPMLSEMDEASPTIRGLRSKGDRALTMGRQVQAVLRERDTDKKLGLRTPRAIGCEPAAG